LIGPGGIGKTRPAVAAARRFGGCDALHFVPLQQVTSPGALVGAIADAAGLRLLVISRVRLNLLEEFVLEVASLASPLREHDMNTERNGAGELLGERARRANTTFVLTEAQRQRRRVASCRGLRTHETTVVDVDWT
jgi:predicted ATPase